jgi:hypothetical protein
MIVLQMKSMRMLEERAFSVNFGKGNCQCNSETLCTVGKISI